MTNENYRYPPIFFFYYHLYCMGMQLVKITQMVHKKATHVRKYQFFFSFEQSKKVSS